MTLGALVVGVAAADVRARAELVADAGHEQTRPERGQPGPGRSSSTPMRCPRTIGATIAGDADAPPGSSASASPRRRVARLGAVPFVGYDGDASWLGYALIEGRWFAGPGEAVAPTNVFTRRRVSTSATRSTIARDGRTVTVRLVGEIFDSRRGLRRTSSCAAPGRTSHALDPAVEPTAWEMRPAAGVDVAGIDRVASRPHRRPGSRLHPRGRVQRRVVPAVPAVVAPLGIVLVAISLGGVFNTVLLETRQRTREMAVLKAVGMTPAPGRRDGHGLGRARRPRRRAGRRAARPGASEPCSATWARSRPHGDAGSDLRRVPAAGLLVLCLAGLAIGLAGAYLPAQRAARARIAPVLQAE